MENIGTDDAPAPSWPTCVHRTRETGRACNGKQVDGFDQCLAHLRPRQLEQVLRRFTPGADLEAPGTAVDAALLARIVRAVKGEKGLPTFGYVNLTQAHFTEDAIFRGVKFSGKAEFTSAHFHRNAEFTGAQFSDYVNGGDAIFRKAQFHGNAEFTRAQFIKNAEFEDAQFHGSAEFTGVQFSHSAGFAGAQFHSDAKFTGAPLIGDAEFAGARFSGNAGFADAEFTSNAGFAGTGFSGDVDFRNVIFRTATSLGPLTAGTLILQGAVFSSPVVIEAAAVSLTCTGTTWEKGVTMRLRLARVDLERATFTVPSSVSGSDQQFALAGPKRLDDSEVVSRIPKEQRGSDDSWMPALSSLRGADAFNLSVTDVDLSPCRFAGARLLDQLRLEGRCIFDHPPERLRVGWAWPPVWHWSSRQSSAEERIWRATRSKYSGWAATRSAEPVEVRPERLAGLYRQLRKAQEDAKNEPGAADFYYGEMEMRRHARSTPAAERGIIMLYWLISGYGLRAFRSLAVLVIIGVIATAALVGWGLAAGTPPQRLIGSVTTTGQNPAQINATLNTTTPQLPPASQRWTGKRTQTALEVTLESIAFRTTTQPLTPAGTWITIAARILGPILLALTLLAVRNRVKR